MSDKTSDKRYKITLTENQLALVGTAVEGMMNDLISRQAAIDAIGKKSDEIYKTKQKGATYPHDDFFQGMAYAENVVKQLPPIQPEPQYKTNYGFMWLCPKCGLPIHSDYTKCVRCGHNREKGVRQHDRCDKQTDGD